VSSFSMVVPPACHKERSLRAIRSGLQRSAAVTHGHFERAAERPPCLSGSERHESAGMQEVKAQVFHLHQASSGVCQPAGWRKADERCSFGPTGCSRHVGGLDDSANVRKATKRYLWRHEPHRGNPEGQAVPQVNPKSEGTLHG
jgi:hypothetical protein